MIEDQKKRIRHVEPGECCDFDGLPMHPHYYYYLTCSGFNNLTEIEEKTEVEFVEIVNNSHSRGGRPFLLKNTGETMAKYLKKNGVCFSNAPEH